MRPAIVHLVQSTVFGIVAAAFVLGLRNNSARVRYGVWFAASMKFLIPFAPLVAVGSLMQWRPAVVAMAARSISARPMEQIGLALRTPFVMPQTRPETHAPIAAALTIVWLCGVLAVSARWAIQWRRVRKIAHAGRVVDIDAGVPVISCGTADEPGVFGILRPVLLMPEGIAERLSAAELNAVIAHEMSHVRRRDNLLAAMHMVVEAVFWFHPLVWWIGARLVEERERACDEDVVRAGSERRVYAESILRTCEFYLESPVECVAGVTGADLKARIVRIMSECSPRNLGCAKRALLAGAAVVAIGAPIAAGLAQSRDESSGKRETFEVALIKPGDPAARNHLVRFLPGGKLRTENITVKILIRVAYKVQSFQIAGEPAWARSEPFDIDATPPHPVGDPDAMPEAERKAFESRISAQIRSLLEDRFALKVHKEMREMPTYSLVVSKNGPKLVTARMADGHARNNLGGSNGQLAGEGATMEMLAGLLSNYTGRTVNDGTGLNGNYDFRLSWTPDPVGSQPDQAAAGTGPSLFTALEEQLGLKLEPKKAPVEVLVIDRLEKPSPN